VRFLVKILCAPVIAVLAVLVWLLATMLRMTAWIFGLTGIFFALLGLGVIFIEKMVGSGVILLIVAFLVSPFGLPMLAAWMLGQIQRVRWWIQEKVWG